MRYELSAKANANLTEIAEWYTLESGPELAQRMLDRLMTTIKRAAQFPHTGSPTRNLYVRVVLSKPYLIRYRVDSDHIRVLSVRHGAREPL